MVAAAAKGNSLFEPGNFETEVLVQPGRLARLVCLTTDFRRAYRVPESLLTQAVIAANGATHFVARGVSISVNDLPQGQFVEVLPLETEAGPAVRVALPPRPLNLYAGAVAIR